MLDKTLSIILAEGQGESMLPLTSQRTVAAVPFGGKYRVIDFPLVNCLHSGLRRILVLTQYKSHSLQKHLRDGWSLFNPELGEYITAVPPQMRTGQSWYTGTADSIYQNLYMLERSDAEQALILSGEQIYRMDYAALLAAHTASGADVTVAGISGEVDGPVPFGTLAVDADCQLFDFSAFGSDAPPGWPEGGQYLTSMGVYVFSTGVLMDALARDHDDEGSTHDLERDILPALIDTHKIAVYEFGGQAGRVSQDRYWRDVSTLDSYFEANMGLLKPLPSLDLYQPEWPIRTYEAQYPPARTVPGQSGHEGIFINSIVTGGDVISGGGVQHSILFPNVRVEEDAMIHDCILLNDVVVGEGAQLKRCIIDKAVVVPPGEKIGFDRAKDASRFTVSEKGVVVIPSDYTFA
ncbi:MAG: glucose-1-phosphate adenylyltransferase [Thiotrichales bacterium]